MSNLYGKAYSFIEEKNLIRSLLQDKDSETKVDVIRFRLVHDHSLKVSTLDSVDRLEKAITFYYCRTDDCGVPFSVNVTFIYDFIIIFCPCITIFTL